MVQGNGEDFLVQLKQDVAFAQFVSFQWLQLEIVNLCCLEQLLAQEYPIEAK